MKIAICGAGVAGPALAHWLLRGGHEITLVEAAPAFRAGGYIVDFWGSGYAVAERMGVLRQVLEAGYPVQQVIAVDERGREISGFSGDGFRKAAGGRFTSVPRGELARAIFETVKDRTEVLFGETVTAARSHETGITVELSRSGPREFDLLVGADGLHSAVRGAVFGPQTGFERPLGYYVAAWEAAGYRPRDVLTYVGYTTPGRAMARFSLHGDRTLFLFMFDAALLTGPEPQDRASRTAAMRQVFGGEGWEVPAMLETLDDAPDIYLDRVSQIVMPRWSKERTVLVGDAAACVSLLAGEGAGLAITEAYVLAGELAAAGSDYAAAFARYEARLRPLLAAKQKSAQRYAGYFVPKTPFGVWFRDRMLGLLAVPGLGDWLIARDLRDDFDLPRHTFDG